MDEIKSTDNDTKRVRKAVSDFGQGNECSCEECDGCFETVQIKAKRIRKPRVKKLTVPVISQETIDALMKRGTADLPELLSMDNKLYVEPRTVYAKDTYLDNDVYVEPATTSKRK